MDERLNKLEELHKMKINPYPYKYERTHTFAELRESFEKISQTAEIVTSCGRILAVRGHGKTVFATVTDNFKNAGLSSSR